MQYRKEPLTNGEVYHIFTRSIEKFVVFNDLAEYQRMIRLLDLYRYKNFDYKLSKFDELSRLSQEKIIKHLRSEGEYLVEIVAYCCMPTHLHLILKQTADGGISKFLARILNGYSRYFNTKHRRTGPLWSGRFKSVLVKVDEQLLHLSRYIHLNPTSAKLVRMPEEWEFSSYKVYVDLTENQFCSFGDLVNAEPTQYRRFVEDRISYQKQLSIIKSVMIDDYSG